MSFPDDDRLDLWRVCREQSWRSLVGVAAAVGALAGIVLGLAPLLLH
jgi:hypothetical protein